MTEPVHTPAQPQQAAYLDDEIDLRQYIELLISWWREIVLIAVGVAILAGLAVLALRLLPSAYQSSAEVAIVRVQSNVTFDEKFTTMADEQTSPSNASARRSALIGFAASNSIAQKVIEQLGDLLETDERIADELQKQVEIASTSTGTNRAAESDLIRITATASTPQKAAAIATAWAKIFVQEANLVYGQTPFDLVVTVESALVDAQTNYDGAQQKLITFLAENKSDELARQIQQKEQVIKELLTGQQTALQTALTQVLNAKTRIANAYLQAQTASEILAYQSSQEAQQELLRTYIAAQYQSQLDVFQQQVTRDQQLLSTYNNASIRLQKTLTGAKVLKTQIESGSETVDGGTVAALQLLKIQTFSDVLERSTPQNTQAQLPSLFQRQSILSPEGQDASANSARPFQLQVQDTPLQLQINAEQSMSKAVALTDIGALIDSIETQLEEIAASTATLSAKLLSGEGYAYLQQSVPISSPLGSAIALQDALLQASSAEVNTTAALSSSFASSTLFPDLSLAELEQVANQYGSFDPDSTEVITNLEENLRLLRSKLETEQAHQRELAQNRDLAWGTLTTVNSKVAELKVAQAAGSSEVRFAAPAVEPTNPVEGIRLSLAIVAGGMAGGLLAVFYAFIASFMGQKPFLRRSALA